MDFASDNTVRLWPCRWDWCRAIFPNVPELRSHVVDEHVHTSERIPTAQLKTWKGEDGLWYGREKGYDTLMASQISLSGGAAPFPTAQSSQVTQGPKQSHHAYHTPETHHESQLTQAEEDAVFQSIIRSPSPATHTRMTDATTTVHTHQPSSSSQPVVGDTSNTSSTSTKIQTQQIPPHLDTSLTSSNDSSRLLSQEFKSGQGQSQESDNSLAELPGTWESIGEPLVPPLPTRQDQAVPGQQSEASPETWGSVTYNQRLEFGSIVHQSSESFASSNPRSSGQDTQPSSSTKDDSQTTSGPDATTGGGDERKRKADDSMEDDRARETERRTTEVQSRRAVRFGFGF